MKYYFPVIVIIFLISFTCCRKTVRKIGSEGDIFNYSWGTQDRVLIEDNQYHSYKYLDSVSHQLKGDTLIPIEYIGRDRLIIKKLVPTSMDMIEQDGMIDFVITKALFLPDTFTIGIKKYIDNHFLILFSEMSASSIYALKEKEIQVKEINAGYQPEYKISGYSVGDLIDRDKIEIVNVDIFGSMKTEEAVLIGNEQVVFTILGDKYIEKIGKTNISDQELVPLIRSIDKVFSGKHEYDEIMDGSGDYEEIIKGYYWNEKDVSISLQKIERNYERDEENSWTLEYSNYIITNILQNYLKPVPENL